MPKFVWAALATGALTLAAVLAYIILLMSGVTSSLPLQPFSLFGDVAATMLLSSGIVFMFWLWQTPTHTQP